ncbi:patatin-like phospholipase family protein [Robertmurraya korlensis]|uniref:patatin-like phospholipase family protein n=1 Tax=Robertmurraya korlensis TaxID=519977 RepID=UPI0035277B60
MFVDGTGLVLEGGGMRGVYTAGVLESFLENGLSFPYVIGVSAGACNAASYLSQQKGRNKRVNLEYISDSRYLSLQNYIKKRELFGMDFIFNEIPSRLIPFDFESFYQNNTEFVIGTTDCASGEPVYFNKSDYGQEMLTVLKASSSLPFVSQEIFYKGKYLLDGGISDSIPLKKAKSDGYEKNVVVLTRNDGYTKKPSRFGFLVKKRYPHYPGLQRALTRRYQMYNDTINEIIREEKKGNIMVIRPSSPIKVGRLERNATRLEELYQQGYEDGLASIHAIMKL